ncbi:MAG: hypothetical protein U5L00_18895 [Desulfovermiculus sp.]|nr:hypothetical protein [Desulfovermiculus sp.]
MGAGNASNYKRYSDEVRGLHTETQAHMRRGDWDKSENLLRTILRWEEQIPGEIFVETKSLLEQQEKGYAEYKAYAARYKKESSELMKRQCLDMARAKIIKMRKRHLIAGDGDWAQTYLEHIDKIQRDCDAGIIEYGNKCGRDRSGDGLAVVVEEVHVLEGRATPPETVHLGDIQGELTSEKQEVRHPITMNRPGDLKVNVQAEETLENLSQSL